MDNSKDKVVVSLVKRSDIALGANASKALKDALRPTDAFAVTSDVPAAEASGTEIAEMTPLVSFISVKDISFSPYQTREMSNETELEGLAKSITNKGVLQPIIVRPASSAAGGVLRYELVCGERRLRAAKLGGLQQVPAIVQELTDKEAVEFSIIENAQRENLNPVEEALAYRHLVEKFDLTQAEIAQIIGKNRATVANALRLLQLDLRVLEMLKQGAFTAGHGRALLMVEDGDEQYRFAKRIIRGDLSVRALETQISGYLQRKEGDAESSEDDEKERASIERQKTKISTWLGLEHVSLREDERGRKCLNLVFDREAAWKRFLAKIRE